MFENQVQMSSIKTQTILKLNGSPPWQTQTNVYAHTFAPKLYTLCIRFITQLCFKESKIDQCNNCIIIHFETDQFILYCSFPVCLDTLDNNVTLDNI